MSDPSFFSEQAILDLHEDLLEAFGGLAGHNPELVGTLAAYPQQKYAYQLPEPSIQDLAAYYGYAAARFHAFSDGNKRVAFSLTALFLRDHGFDFVVDLDEAKVLIEELAADDISEEDFVTWVNENAKPL